MGKDKLNFMNKIAYDKKCEYLNVLIVHLAIANTYCIVHLNNVSENKKRIINTIFELKSHQLLFFLSNLGYHCLI